VVHDTDEGIRANTTVATLGALDSLVKLAVCPPVEGRPEVRECVVCWWGVKGGGVCTLSVISRSFLSKNISFFFFFFKILVCITFAHAHMYAFYIL
jgi:hypothetical protein